MQFITGTKPFPDIRNEGRVIRAICSEPPILPDITQHTSFTLFPELLKILPLCWTSDPRSRAKIEQCLAAVRLEVRDLTFSIVHLSKYSIGRLTDTAYTHGGQRNTAATGIRPRPKHG